MSDQVVFSAIDDSMGHWKTYHIYSIRMISGNAVLRTICVEPHKAYTKSRVTNILQHTKEYGTDDIEARVMYLGC